MEIQILVTTFSLQPDAETESIRLFLCLDFKSKENTPSLVSFRANKRRHVGEVKGGNCGTVHGGLRKSKKAEFREGRREGKGMSEAKS